MSGVVNGYIGAPTHISMFELRIHFIVHPAVAGTEVALLLVLRQGDGLWDVDLPLMSTVSQAESRSAGDI